MTRVATLEKAAVGWLAKRESEAASSEKLAALLRELQEPPPFLPEASRAELDALTVEVRRRVDNANEEIAGQQQDQATIAVLNMMQATGPLAQLTGWLDCAKGVACHSSMARDLQAKKVSQLEKTIQEMREFASSLPERLDAVGSVQGARSLAQAIRHVEARYEGTAEHEVVANGVKRGEELESLFVAVAEIDGTIDRVKQPAEVEGLRGKVQALLSEHGACLAASQEAAVRQRGNAIEARVATLEKAAVEWLAKRKSAAASSEKLAALLRELQEPPPFLPEASRAELDALAVEVRQRVDADLSGQIVRLFKKIGDSAEQRRVLDELQKLFESK
jgi:hypothetical protein